MEQLTKKCTKCGRILPLNFFPKHKLCKYGVAGTCKECARIAIKAYREANKDKVAEQQRKWREEHKDEKRERDRRYHEEHKEERNKRAREYRQKNKEKIREKQKDWVKRNEERLKEYHRKYHEDYKERCKTELKARTKLSNAIRDGKISRPNKCDRCGKKCTPDGHHWNYAYPLNVVWLCRSCHKIVHLKFGCIHENINGEIG
ncbi:hypothetical protein EST52_13335 [Escherichia coli]|uniref:hypothetical protein n=1 Tax=Escherichia coli TaxID=562 RepID=UPI001C60E614|nr:hypothetical protein [Escherichia coli]MBW5340855.1 hypothetical protein [Escherichia coli]